LLSLKFGFRNFSVEVRDGRANLIPRPIVRKPMDSETFVHKLIVEFPPQHVAEEATPMQLGVGGTPTDKLDTRDRLKQPGGPYTPPAGPPAPFPVIAKTRLSGPTRLVFRIKEGDGKDLARKILSVRTLTDWSELAQVVSERAMRADAPLTDQLKMVGIDRSTNRAEALIKIIQSIRPPREDETAIEFPYRLILSPDSRARWITPQHSLGTPETPTPLWNARLDRDKGGQSVRALWARDILLDFLRGNKPADFNPNRPREHGEPPFVQSLSRSDRRELVTLSSVYGLPALRRVVLDKDKALAAAPGTPLPNLALDNPAGTVLPFPAGIGLWDKVGNEPKVVQDEGVYVPKPLMAADLSLTTIGATFIGEGQWEPPSPIVNDPSLNSQDPDIEHNWRPSLRLERWNHRAVLGRDIYVEIAYKGFLFPIGHRASLLKVTERRFFARTDATKKPTAYLIQRLFIVIGKRVKKFPAVGQPFDGRPWPAHTITMAAGRTPDLKDPEFGDAKQTRQNGRVLVKDEDGTVINGLVFWPRVAAYPAGPIKQPVDLANDEIRAADGKEVAFQFRKDDDSDPVTAPFLFVDNVAAHEPKTMRAVIDYYRSLPDDSGLRRATHGSVLRRYAPPLKGGETEFDTQSWDLSATGRYVNNPSAGTTEIFRMDGIMEGADQPPYYPVVRTANIKVQSIDRLVGTPAGSMTAAFNELYVRHAFAPEQNPSELFLDVLHPAIYLNFAGAGDAVGGLAKPNARLVALSRKFGPVGGRAPPPASSVPSRSIVAPGSAAPPPIGGLGNLPPRGDYSAFAAGVMDPKEFLGGADALPKLLGIFSLADVLKAVAFANRKPSEQEALESKIPKLQETTSFGGGGIDLGDQLAKAKAVVEKMAASFLGDGAGSKGLIDEALQEITNAFPRDLEWQKLYPRLAGAFEALRSSLISARNLAGHITDPPRDLPKLLKAASAIVNAGRALIAEAQAVRDNPIPPLVGTILKTLQEEWEKIRRFAKIQIGGAEVELEKIVEHLRDEVTGELDVLYKGLLNDASAPLANIDTQTIIGLLLSAIPTAPYKFSFATSDQKFASGTLRLNSTIQNGATAILVNLTDANGVQITSLVDALDGSALTGLGYMRLVHATDESKWLLFKLTKLESRDGYRNLSVVIEASSAASPFADDAPVLLAFIPSLNFRSLDPAAIGARIANTLLYEVAGESLVSAYAAVRDLAAVLSGGVDENARDIGAKLMALTAKLFDVALALARVAETSGAMAADWCQDATDFAVDISDRVIEKGEVLSKNIVKVGKAAAAIKLPEQTPSDIRVKVEQARAAMAQAQERLARCISELETRRTEVRNFATQCAKIRDALSLSGRILALRRDAVAALQDLILQARMIAAAINEIQPSALQSFASAPDDLKTARAAVADVVKELIGLFNDLTSIRKFVSNPGPEIARIEANITKLTNKLTGTLSHYATEINEARDKLKSSAAALDVRANLAIRAIQKWSSSGGKDPFPPDLAAIGADVLSYATQHDRRIAALVLQSSQTFQVAKDKLQATAAQVLKLVASPLAVIHDVTIKAAETVGAYIDPATAAPENKILAEFLAAILSEEVVKAFTNLTAIKNDKTALDAIRDNAGAPATFAVAFSTAFALKDQWVARGPALVRTVNEIARIVESLAHGQLSAIINLDRIRTILEEQLKEALLSFIPTKVELAYDWKTELQPFANVFEMRESRDNDLTLSVKADLDLLNPENRTTSIVGTMRGFRVHILGKASGSGENSVGNFLSIYFNGASFTSINGSKPDFKADIDDVKIGPLLKFIQELGKYLSYSGGGFYVRLTLSPLGVEAGFEYNEKVIPFGAITFFNVAFSVSAKLPFQDRDARFRFALASADDPFMLSVLPCYGGGGFFAITSNGREIVQAECSAEFGAILGLKFGPLSAVGRVMAGIYIRQGQGGGAYIKGFVHAVGEGCIACFSLTVNIEVCIIHQANGQMYGQSSYRFTFKVGFAEVGYGVTATYSVSGGGGGGGGVGMLSSGPPAIVAQIMKAHPKCDLKKRHIVIRVPSKTRRWERYRKSIDLDLMKG
jgi:hypothetical protein